MALDPNPGFSSRLPDYQCYRVSGVLCTTAVGCLAAGGSTAVSGGGFSAGGGTTSTATLFVRELLTISGVDVYSLQTEKRIQLR